MLIFPYAPRLTQIISQLIPLIATGLCGRSKNQATRFACPRPLSLSQKQKKTERAVVIAPLSLGFFHSTILTPSYTTYTPNYKNLFYTLSLYFVFTSVPLLVS
jgi:hypothetical protein